MTKVCPIFMPVWFQKSVKEWLVKPTLSLFKFYIHDCSYSSCHSLKVPQTHKKYCLNATAAENCLRDNLLQTTSLEVAAVFSLGV